VGLPSILLGVEARKGRENEKKGFVKNSHWRSNKFLKIGVILTKSGK